MMTRGAAVGAVFRTPCSDGLQIVLACFLGAQLHSKTIRRGAAVSAVQDQNPRTGYCFNLSNQIVAQ
jgi:hypothetical protein